MSTQTCNTHTVIWRVWKIEFYFRGSQVSNSAQGQNILVHSGKDSHGQCLFTLTSLLHGLVLHLYSHFFFFLTIWNERAEERSNFAFTTIRKSTGLFSQAVSSAQLASSPAHTASSTECLSQYSTSLTTSVCITTRSLFDARLKFESNQRHIRPTFSLRLILQDILGEIIQFSQGSVLKVIIKHNSSSIRFEREPTRRIQIISTIILIIWIPGGRRRSGQWLSYSDFL